MRSPFRGKRCRQAHDAVDEAWAWQMRDRAQPTAYDAPQRAIAELAIVQRFRHQCEDATRWRIGACSTSHDLVDDEQHQGSGP